MHMPKGSERRDAALEHVPPPFPRQWAFQEAECQRQEVQAEEWTAEIPASSWQIFAEQKDIGSNVTASPEMRPFVCFILELGTLGVEGHISRARDQTPCARWEL